MSRPEHAFGKYALVHKIADGGMGEIQLAADMALNRPVAIKRVLETLTDRPDVSRMFEAEATVMSVLSHDNIVRIFESGAIDGRFYIAMEYIHGKTLRQLIDRARTLGEPPPLDLVITIFSQLARALHHAHEKVRKNGMPMGLVHRDVNPQNLLMAYDGGVKLIDFGIVQTDDDLAPDDLEPKGKIAYMSPEQTFGGRIDRRSDLFSLAVCLYEALTLYNPFIRGSDAKATADAVRAAKAPPPSSANHRLLPFDAILEVALAREPGSRLETTEQLADVLDDLLATKQVGKTVPLSAYLQDTFEATKVEEDRILEGVQLSSSSTMVIQDTSALQSIRAEVDMQPSGVFQLRELSAEYSQEEPELPRPPSNVPFNLALAAIALLTIFSSVTVYSRVLKTRQAEAMAARARFIAAQEQGTRATKTRDTKTRVPAQGAERAIVQQFGSLTLSTTPQVRVHSQGHSSDHVRLMERGTISVGQGGDPRRDPFALTLLYSVSDAAVKIEVGSEPWAIAYKSSGVALGKTPVILKVRSQETIEFKHPKRNSLKITFNFLPQG